MKTTLKNSLRIFLSGLLVIAASVFCSKESMASGHWVTSGWHSTDEVTYVTPDSPGAATYSSTPYVTAYQGKSGAQAVVQAKYQQYWSWSGGSYNDPPTGWLTVVAHLVGTLGFYENPVSPDYNSAAGNSWGKAGPPDYDYSPADIQYAGSFQVGVMMVLTAEVWNYGHSSAELNASIGGYPAL